MICLGITLLILLGPYLAHLLPLGVLAAPASDGTVTITVQDSSVNVQPFWLNYIELYTKTNAEVRRQAGGMVIQEDPNDFYGCNDQTWQTLIWPMSGDVSGNKYGMRVSPNKDIGGPLYYDPLDQVELNTNYDYVGHQTFYADRNGGLYPTSGDADGNCIVNRTYSVTDMTCTVGGMYFEASISSMLYCTPV
ncbi:hypothetical protein F5Y16DRAFT_41637 [Xylariaceae sp. FL0255]|nr:hypothetical protein F5Y16DRAFT_41637 [Xylariaceae sp. FL0255]